jgi:hypothetical protein
MKTIIILLLIFASSLAPAAVDPNNVCGVANPTRSVEFQNLVDAGAYQCLPLPTSTSTGLSFGTGSAGQAVWWYCKRPDGRWSANVGAATWGWISGASLIAEARASASLAEFNKAALRLAKTPMEDPALLPVWCPHFAAILDGRPASDPPPSTWTVAKNGIYSTRPAYTQIGNLLSTTTGRATVGAKCDCAKPLAFATTTYCTFAGALAATTVAVCTKVPP